MTAISSQVWGRPSNTIRACVLPQVSRWRMQNSEAAGEVPTAGEAEQGEAVPAAAVLRSHLLHHGE